jgi:hypothetical protein
MDVIAQASMGCDMGALQHLLTSKPGDPSPWLVAAAEDVFAGAVLQPALALPDLLGPKTMLNAIVTRVLVAVFRVRSMFMCIGHCVGAQQEACRSPPRVRAEKG